MLGLFGLLNLGSRSLQTQRAGVEIAGQNLANVNNPAYARQRLSVSTAPSIPTELGPQGTGVQAVAIVQLRDRILDEQIQGEISVRSSLEGQQSALQRAQADLGQLLDRLSSSSDTPGLGSSRGLAGGLSDLFNAFQSLSTSPTSQIERQALLSKATGLASQFNQADQRLSGLNDSLNQSIQADVASANALLSDVANLNRQISTTEFTAGGTANDLRDLRQQKLEELAKLVKVNVAGGDDGSVNVSIDGVDLVVGRNVTETLAAFDAGNGNVQLRTATAGTNLNPAGGRIHGLIEARDGAVADLRSSINSLASLLIAEVNGIHSGGFSLTGSTGENFFVGTNVSDIRVNGALLDNPALVQASGESGAVGDNRVALALAQLAQKGHASLGGQTFDGSFSQIVASLGESLASVNTRLGDQEALENMLLQQRASVSGVSLDEEMADLAKYQRAFQASARLVNTVDEMLETVISLKR